jgi:CRISPR-associated protein Cmr3
VGIARSVENRTASEGMLYAPTFTRLASGGHFVEQAAGTNLFPDWLVALAVRVSGVDNDLQQRCGGVRRLGGEGRLVQVEIAAEPHLPQRSPVLHSSRLLFLTPARFGGTWHPPGATSNDDLGWRTSLAGVPATIVTAAVSKPVRIGGWDIVQRRPKPAELCLAPGSVYFVQSDGPGGLDTLHDRKLGSGTPAGFGHVVVAPWTPQRNHQTQGREGAHE